MKSCFLPIAKDIKWVMFFFTLSRVKEKKADATDDIICLFAKEKKPIDFEYPKLLYANAYLTHSKQCNHCMKNNFHVFSI